MRRRAFIPVKDAAPSPAWRRQRARSTSSSTTRLPATKNPASSNQTQTSPVFSIHLVFRFGLAPPPGHRLGPTSRPGGPTAAGLIARSDCPRSRSRVVLGRRGLAHLWCHTWRRFLIAVLARLTCTELRAGSPQAAERMVSPMLEQVRRFWADLPLSVVG